MSKVVNFWNTNDAAKQTEEPAIAVDPVSAFRKALAENGFILQGDDILADGILRRYEGPGDGRGKKNCWAVLHADPPAGAYGSWRTGQEFSWSHKGAPVSDETWHRIRQARLAEQEARQKEARERCVDILNKSIPCTAHPYLQSKQVKPYGNIRIDNGKIAVPATDVDGTVHSVQWIDSTGDKRFLPGGAIGGHFFHIPGNGKIAIVEGYATGATVHEATGWAVYVAFDCGNLGKVAEKVRRQYPTTEIIIAGDNDWKTDGNPGKTKAEEAASAISGTAILPKGIVGTDWNDVACEMGLEEVKRHLLNVTDFRFDILDWGPGKFIGDPPERQWLVKDIIPLACAGMLAAAGDTGKGMMLLKLGIEVASKPKSDFLQHREAFGHRVENHGAVVLFLAEDDRDEVHRRLHSLGLEGDEDLYVIPLPNAGGPMPLVVPGKHGPEFTPAWHAIKQQLHLIKDLRLVVFDPLASMVMADINADPAAGAFVTGGLATLATETGATVVVAHHLAKTKDSIKTPEQARALVRGSTALVDGLRFVYTLWGEAEKSAKQICVQAGVSFERNRVVRGCVVKSNGPADREIRTYVRNGFGLLEPRDDVIDIRRKDERDTRLDLLERAIGWAASVGFPFTLTGQGGLWQCSDRLPSELRHIARNELEALGKHLLNDGRVLRCTAQGNKSTKWLDVPGGNFASGEGVIGEGEAPQWRNANDMP